MNEQKALEIIDKIFMAIFNMKNPFTLEEILSQYAFDVKLPQEVRDSTTNEPTWADSINMTSFITLENMQKHDEVDGWMVPKKNVTSLEEIINVWKSINFMTTERVYDSVAVAQSDTIYGCENVFRCVDCRGSKNIIFCDGVGGCEYLMASQRSGTTTFCIRCSDSADCTNSYNVICSNKVSNSLFIQDCFNLHECIFCSHIANKRYCIANMQFEKEEYFEIKKEIIKWILNIK